MYFYGDGGLLLVVGGSFMVLLSCCFGFITRLPEPGFRTLTRFKAGRNSTGRQTASLFIFETLNPNPQPLNPKP